jgi:hypothetical protein
MIDILLYFENFVRARQRVDYACPHRIGAQHVA